MWITFGVHVVAILLLGFRVWGWGRDLRVGTHKTAQSLRIVGLVPLGLQFGFFMLFAFGEMMGGDLSGASHLLQAVGPALLAVLAWMRPFEAGVALIIAGLVSAAAIPDLTASLILAGPDILSGILFTTAGTLVRKLKISA